jgi:hypothetical protein
MSHDDEDDDVLAGVNLEAWRVPPAPAATRASVLTGALAPAGRPKRSRMTWLVAAFAIGNVVLAALLVIVLSRPAAQPTIRVLPAGGGIDAQTQEALRRLDDQQRQLEAKLGEVQQLRSAIQQLSSKLEQCENRKTVINTPPVPVPVPPAPTQDTSCDEVSCVLTNNAGSCCDRYRKVPAPKTPPSALPATLDRQMISDGIAQVKPSVTACGHATTATGVVKVHVRIEASGRVSRVDIEHSPDNVLGGCVAGAVQKAVFPPTQQGGSFTYPFVF